VSGLKRFCEVSVCFGVHAKKRLLDILARAERMNDETRAREKTMRGSKTKDTAILTGYQLFQNFIRPHEALNGKTPSEACGITIEGKNKWKTLIQNASKKR
jgi:hypothetical protein